MAQDTPHSKSNRSHPLSNSSRVKRSDIHVSTTNQAIHQQKLSRSSSSESDKRSSVKAVARSIVGYQLLHAYREKMAAKDYGAACNHLSELGFLWDLLTPDKSDPDNVRMARDLRKRMKAAEATAKELEDFLAPKAPKQRQARTRAPAQPITE